MSENSVKRKLTAILCADVKGYSRMMGEDEDGTFHTLSAYLEIINSIIKEHRGRVFSSPGDAVLAQFASVVDAVRCGVEIQEKIEAKNADFPEDRKMQFRIGVNLGDVIEKEEQIYGDGVNIAARIETLAKPGGVSISRTVYNHVHNKLKFGYEYQGEHQVKNIAEPVKVYKILTSPEHAGQLLGSPISPKRLSKQSNISILVVLALVVVAVIWQFYPRTPKIEPASVDKMAYPLPEKPSIAVLPFDNMTGDPGQEFFSDGITEQIISSLSKTNALFVIARNSTFTYKGKPVKVKQVAEELGVRYVLEGSVRKSEERVRITAQLIDAVEGHHLWAENYDRELKDIFELQDEITIKIINALAIKLTEGEGARIIGKQHLKLDVYLKYLQALSLLRKATKESAIQLGQVAQEIVEMAPESHLGYSMLAWNNFILGMYYGVSPQEKIGRALKLAKKALSIDDTYPHTYGLLGNVYLAMKQHEKAIAAGEQSVALEPNGAIVHSFLGNTLCFAERIDEGINHNKQGIRLNPFPASWQFFQLGFCYNMKGNYKKALIEYQKALQLSPDYIAPYFGLASIYVALDRQEEARAAVKKILELDPHYSIERSSRTWPYKNPDRIKRVSDALHKAGLPYNQPLPLPDKPSIAVLAFDNLSGDPEQEYFSDGLSEEIITALSKTDKLFVIARNSSFTYKGKPVNIKQISRELGVRYVLEGSVRKSEDRVRITAQLIDATTEHHLWSERYDRDLKDFFDLQDEITIKIVIALQVELTEGEQARMWGKRVKNYEVGLKYLEALSLLRKGTKESFLRYGQVAKEIIDMAPENPDGYIHLAWYNWLLAFYGITPQPQEKIEKAFELAQKALSIDRSIAEIHSLLGNIYLLMRQFEKAIAAGEQSVRLEPNGANVHYLLGNTLCYAGKIDEGISEIKQGIRLNPIPNGWYYIHLGRCYRQKGLYKEALIAYQKALQRNPEYIDSHLSLAVMYGSSD